MLLYRLTNVIKISAGYVVSRITRRVIHLGKPIAISIEPTNTCNLHCPECPSGLRELTRPGGMMSLETFRSVIDQLSPQLSYLTLYFQGEPFLNGRFSDMVKYARSKNIFVGSSTNGHFLSSDTARRTVESGLNRLIISLDGTSQTTYASYRIGGSFEQVTQGIKNLVQAKKELNSGTPKIIIQFLVLKSNEHQIEEVIQLGKSLGVDKVELKSAQFYDYKQGNPLMPDNAKYSRYQKSPRHHVTTAPRQNNTTYRLKNNFPRHCFRMWSGCVITWDGKVVPCCYDKDAEHQLGDLTKQSFMEIWKNYKYHDFRKQILSHREKIDICQNCTEGMGISAIW